MNQLESLVDEVVRRHAAWTARWHEAETPPERDLPWVVVEQNHRMNFNLWHEEDKARRDDRGAEAVRRAKRAIDRFNQARNDAFERLDEWLLPQLPPVHAGTPMNSETPGQIMDRLSILALKIYHMRIEAVRPSAEAQQRRKCAEKCAVLEEQLRDLKTCFRDLLGQLQAGERQFKIYRQFKMYNDRDLNPQLYGKAPGNAP